MYFKPILYCKFALGPYGSRIPKIQHAIVNFRVIETEALCLFYFLYFTHLQTYTSFPNILVKVSRKADFM